MASIIIVVVVVAGDVAGAFGTFQFLVKLVDDGSLNHLATGGVDGMGDIGVKLRSSMVVEVDFFAVLTLAAVVAEAGSQMILGIAVAAVSGQLAAGHGHKRPGGSFNDLEVTNDEAVIKGY